MISENSSSHAGSGASWPTADHADVRQATYQMVKYWRVESGISNWAGEDVFAALYQQFVAGVAVSNQTLNEIRQGPVIYVANHQVALESITFAFALTAMGTNHIRALAKEAHQTSWVGELLGLLYQYPGISPPPPAFFRDEYDPQSLISMLGEMRQCLTDQGQSLLIHAEGARVLNCRRPISQLSAVFLDMARETGRPIIPVHFSGGLPVESLDNYRDFPIGFGAQTYHLGPPISADALSRCHPKDRRAMVTEAVNNAAGILDLACPATPDRAFEEAVQAFLHETATTQVKAVIVTALRGLADPSEQTQRILQAIESNSLHIGHSPAEQWLGSFCTWLSDGRAKTLVNSMHSGAT